MQLDGERMLMPKTKRKTLRIHEDIHAALTTLAQANDWTMTRLLIECMDLVEIAQKCIRIEVVWGNRSEAPLVKVWMPHTTEVSNSALKDGACGEGSATPCPTT
jgi:hypothetical protein